MIVKVHKRLLDPRDCKRRRLERALNIGRHQAIGILVDFWGLVCDTCGQTGVLPWDNPAVYVEEYLDTEGVYAALKEAGFIERDGRTVHEWFAKDHTGFVYAWRQKEAQEAKERRAREKAAKRGAGDGGRTDSGGNGNGASAAGDYTEEDRAADLAILHGHAGYEADSRGSRFFEQAMREDAGTDTDQ